jgi:hypothetical protein
MFTPVRALRQQVYHDVVVFEGIVAFDSYGVSSRREKVEVKELDAGSLTFVRTRKVQADEEMRRVFSDNTSLLLSRLKMKDPKWQRIGAQQRGLYKETPTWSDDARLSYVA